jgi:hypothetical protein
MGIAGASEASDEKRSRRERSVAAGGWDVRETVPVTESTPYRSTTPRTGNPFAGAVVRRHMADKPQSGELFGVPYNFERPSIGRMLSSYWQPGEGMLVEKPFGVGYTLNLANWRSWVVLLVAGGLYYQQTQSAKAADEEPADEPVEVLVDD